MPAAARRLVRRRPVLLGSVNRTGTIGDSWGYDRGTPVDRWYIERFLDAQREHVTGVVLEVKDSGYTDRFGRGVTERAVLDVDPANPHATVVADLAAADDVPSERFDCFVLTQTLQFVYDVPSALAHAHRILRPGGVLLATVPVASRYAEPPLTDYWRFTPLAATRLFREAFPAGTVDVWAKGNVLSVVAFLEGLSAEEIAPAKLAVDDERLPLLICVRARKAG